MFSLIHARLTCAEDVEDETQETFATAFRRLSMLRDAAQFRPWLARIAVNQASSRVRANARRADTPSDLRPADLAWGWSYQLPWLLARCIVTRAVDALSDAEADAVRMRCIDGSSFREIGVRVGISGNAAEKRVKQAVRRLRSRCLHAH